MVASFLTGIILALAQHFHYRKLHHTEENDENKKIRVVLYGRAFAYFSKVAFTSCVIFCYRQRMWRTFREKALSVFAIDQIFLATEDPSLFLNWEVVQNATLVTAMALVIWLIPIATIIFSPSALSFGWYFEASSSELFVPTLNFTVESYKDWRTPQYMPDGTTKKKSVMFYNTTDKQGKEQGWFDYYDQPSSDVTRTSLMVAYSLKDQPLNRQDARIVSCGGHYNCTYSISFVGPGYKCDNVAMGVGDKGKLEQVGAPFNISTLVPEGKHAYYAEVDIGDYKRPQSNNLSNDGGIPLPGTITNDLGVFKSEPVLWIGYSINTTEPLADNDPFANRWTHRFEPHIFMCEHYETKYTVEFNYSEPFVSTKFSYDFLAPVVNTNFSRRDDGTMNYDNPSPPENFVSPRTDVPRYKKAAAYHAMGQSLRKFLRGKVELEPPKPGPSYAKVYSEVTMTRLVSNSSDTPLSDFSLLLQDFYTDMILSLFSAPQMLVVDQERVVVNRTRYLSTFVYDARKLWLWYFPVIALCLLCLGCGAWTIYEDGTTFSEGFSRIMVTTRNPTLDEISRGACLGNDPFPMELMRTRLKFGVLGGPSEMEYMGVGAEGWQGYGHCAFGVPAEVAPIQKGVPYAGLHYKRETIEVKKEKID
ncbi:hypothetical protein BS50DRAFT_492588 [Corynespora cassiicola Philippines]|uniref:Uncharacterized protein n=1 Tax=Corynespora cassiicola Philippines TaxID=1448308 RepID=A0A2T2NSF6_CORCC|nr:hypothetical protein BS50DRAFT_492588 [Corynespora cassiicola Philippines]